MVLDHLFDNWSSRKRRCVVCIYFKATSQIFIYPTSPFHPYQIFLGGRVSSNYAGLACPDFPTCYGSWFPDLNGNIGFQMEHRWFGYIVALLVYGTTSFAIFELENKNVKTYLKIGCYLITLQILLGALNVIYNLPKLLTGIHTLNAVATLLVCYVAAFYHFREPRIQK